MSSDWPLATIDDIKAETKGSIAIGPFGSRMKSDCYVNQGIPVIRGTNLTGGPTFEGNFVYITEEKADALGSSNVYQYDLVFPHRGSIGEVGIILEDERYVLSSSLMKLTCDRKRVNPKFVYYFFKSRAGRHELLKNASQVGTPGIGQPLTSLKSIEFRMPPLVTQNFIENILTSLDEKIDLNRQANQTLEAIVQTIFKSWFVDFEPVKAKMTVLAAGGSAEEAERAAMCAISARNEASLNTLQTEQPDAYAELASTAALFPSAMQDSELGEIPEGWEIGIIADLLDFNPKRTLKKGTPAPYLDMKNVPTSGHQAQEVVIREMASGTKFINGDTLLARITPCLENGKTAYVDFLENEQVGWGSTEYIVIRPKEGIPTSLGYFIARFESFRSIAIQSMTGTSGRQRANADVLSKHPWIKYPIPLLICFDEIAGQYLLKAKNSGDENRNLAGIRDTLLPKLLSGELTLPDNTLTNANPPESDTLERQRPQQQPMEVAG